MAFRIAHRVAEGEAPVAGLPRGANRPPRKLLGRVRESAANSTTPFAENKLGALMRARRSPDSATTISQELVARENKKGRTTFVLERTRSKPRRRRCPQWAGRISAPGPAPALDLVYLHALRFYDGAVGVADLVAEHRWMARRPP
jgi:hypothetical protein